MKGLKTWIWMGCLCLGITQTVSTTLIIQSLFSSLSNRTNSTNSSSVSKLQQRNYAVPQLFTRIVSHHDQQDKVTGYNHAVKGPANLVAMPTKATFSVGKRSVKRGEVNYFGNLTNQSIPSDSLQQAFKIMSRHKRTAKKTSKAALRNEQERKQQIQQEGDHRRRESAVRRKEVREEKLMKIKNRRLQLKNTRKSTGMLHGRERPSISEKTRENREKLRDNNGPRRPLTAAGGNYRSSAHTGLLSKRKGRLKGMEGQYGQKNCGNSIIEEKHKTSMNSREKHCVSRGDRRNHNGEKHSSKGLAKKQSIGLDEKSRHGNSLSYIENSSTKKKSEHPEKNLKEDEKPTVKDQDSKKKIDNQVRKKPTIKNMKSRKSKGLDKDNAVSKSSSLKAHQSTGKHGNKTIAKGNKHEHSGKESESKKPNENKKVHQKGGSKNKNSDEKKKIQKKEKDKEVKAKGTLRKGGKVSKSDEKKKIQKKEKDKEVQAKGTLRKGGKVSKSKVKSTKEHITVVADDSEEKSNDGEVRSQKHKYEIEEKKHAQGKLKNSEKREEKDSGNGNPIKDRSVEKSSKHKVDHSKTEKTEKLKKSKSAKMDENPRKIDKKLKPTHVKNGRKKKTPEGNLARKSKKGSATNKVSTGRPDVENNVNEIQYLGHVLGFGLGNRKHSQTKSRAWTRRVHKRPMTGGYASSGRLTRALSNLYGASASAGF